MFARSLIISVFLCVSFAGGRADITTNPGGKKPPRTPVPVPSRAIPQTVEVMRGQSVRIVLEGHSDKPGGMRFVLRSNPRRGTLSPARQLSPETVEMTYTHSGRGREDEFLFAVQSEGLPVSAAAKVEIRVVEPPSKFEAPDSLDFGETFAGQPVTREILLGNSGGGTLKTKLELPSAWTVEGSAEMELGAGEYSRVTLKFAPDSARQFREQLTYSGLTGRATLLTGEAVAPLEVAPAELVLARDGATLLRSGVVRVTNRTDTAVAVRISSEATVIIPGQVLLKAKGSADVAVSARPDNPVAIDSQLKLSLGDFKTTVPLKAPSLPAVVTFEPAGSLNVGTITTRDGAHGVVVAHNEGGVPATLNLKVGSPFAIESPASVRLAPGERAEIVVAFRSATRGKAQASLQVAYEGNTVELPVFGEVVGSGGPAATPAPMPRQPTPPVKSAKTLEPSTGDAPPVLESAHWPWKPGEYPPISGVAVIGSTRNSVQLSWPAPATPPSRYQMEVLRMDSNRDGEWSLVWVPVDRVDYRTAGNQVIATIEDMPTGGKFTVRVTAINAARERSAASENIEIATQSDPPRRFLSTRTMLGLLIVLISVFAWLRVRSR